MASPTDLLRNPPDGSKPAFRLPSLGHLLKNYMEIEHVTQALASGDASVVEATLERPAMASLLLERDHWDGLLRLSSEVALTRLLARRESLSDTALLGALLLPTPHAQTRMKLWCDTVEQRIAATSEQASILGEAARQAVDRQAWPQMQCVLAYLRLNRDNLQSLVTRAAERDAPPAILEAILARSETGQPLHFGGTVDVLVDRGDWSRLAPLVPHCTAEQSLLALQRLLSKEQHDLAARWLGHMHPADRTSVFDRLRAQAEACAHTASLPREDDWRVLDGVGVLMADDERATWAKPWTGRLPLTEQRILAHQRDEQARAAVNAVGAQRPRLRS